MTLTSTDSQPPPISLTPPPSPSPSPRLRFGAADAGGVGGAGRTLLDGAWWPRSADPAVELPGLVVALDALHGPHGLVKRLMLNVRDWHSHPRRLEVAGRIVRLGYFASQSISLLTALRGSNGDRTDLLVVPPDTTEDVADVAMTLAATPSNEVHAQHILHTISAATARPIQSTPEDRWEGEGGSLANPRRFRHDAALPVGPPPR